MITLIINSAISFSVISGGICWRSKKVYSKFVSVSKIISGSRIIVGNSWLATF